MKPPGWCTLVCSVLPWVTMGPGEDGLSADRPGEDVQLAQRAQDEQHEALIRAFETHDPKAAADAARHHVQHSKDLALERILSGALPVHV